MSKKTYPSAKGRKKTSKCFTGLPHEVQDSDNYKMLTAHGVKLLMDVARQYNGHNNGDLCITYSIMKNRGWRSSGTLQQAKDELLHYGLIQITRPGGRNKAALYALTWDPIHECKGKLDFQATAKPSGMWKQSREKFNKKPKPKINSSTRYADQLARYADQCGTTEGVRQC